MKAPENTTSENGAVAGARKNRRTTESANRGRRGRHGRRSSASPPATFPASTAVGVRPEPSESGERAVARFSVSPAFGAAVTATGFNVGLFPRPKDTVDLNELIAVLDGSCKAASAGDLSQMEQMLASQAHALNAVFNSLAQRAAVNFGEHMAAGEMYLRLAMRAQAQCRSTIEALGELKNPHPVAFVQQANIANGPQQVNNGGPRAGEQENKPTKLLEQSNGKRLDGSTPAAASLTHSPLETLDALNGAEVAAGEGPRVHECVQGRNTEDAADTREGAQVPK